MLTDRRGGYAWAAWGLMTGTAGTLDPGMGMGWEGNGGLMAPGGGATGSAGMPDALEVGKRESWLSRGMESKLWKDLGSS